MSQPGGGGFASAFRTGTIAGLVVIVVVGAALGAYVATGNRLPGQGRTDSGRVLIVTGVPDENGDLVAQVIADVEATDASAPPVVFSVDPTSAVTIVGTSYGHLRDAYPFGGGARVSEAYARLNGGVTLPYIDFGPTALAEAVKAAGGVNLELPSAINVFDGEALYTFPAGAVLVDAEEFRAILNGVAYLPDAERRDVLAQAAERVTALIAGYPGGLGSAINAGTVTTDLGADDVATFVTRLTQAR
ncbi:MAG: hypothetical protein CVT66_04125 [Actinobacteria bacterium HGW-Actinobacteria-6]|nr:MAG: hypothetical protein CVT66_04125 [Actinobacteria bacterium HGW-Actinobacteria-6]